MPAEFALHVRDQRLVKFVATAARLQTARLLTAKRLARPRRGVSRSRPSRTVRCSGSVAVWQSVKCVDQSKRGACDDHTARAR
jgi:hypothetical protein